MACGKTLSELFLQLSVAARKNKQTSVLGNPLHRCSACSSLRTIFGPHNAVLKPTLVQLLSVVDDSIMICHKGGLSSPAFEAQD